MIHHGKRWEFSIGAAIQLRADFDADRLRRLAKANQDAKQTHRLLALAVIYDGGSRTQAAKMVGDGLQIIRDWVIPFNAAGSDGPIDRKAPGKSPILSEAPRWLARSRRGRSLISTVLCVGNTTAMQAQLEEISATVDPGAHAIVLLGKAGWHTSKRLVVPKNITLLPLPPRSPELNRVENVWQFLRDNRLSNRVFQASDDSLAHRCQAWMKLINQPSRITTIGLRNWAISSNR